MTNDFYRQFEDRHRGTRELVHTRLKAYLPFIIPLKQISHAPLAIDLGCGRGEWLELITQAGFTATGVDLDEQMLLACYERSLHAECRDALSALRNLPADSQMLVSGFHLAEHLEFSDLQHLVQEAFRVLKTGGLLILETPNPENIVVGSGNFYLDPSHHRPLPSLLLSFLPEFYGFDRVKVLRLQEPLNLKQSRTLTIHDVLGGVSPDYAVIAQKNSSQLGEDFLAQAFNRSYGISLEDVSRSYGEQQNNRFVNQDALIASLQARLSTLEKILSPLLWANRQRWAWRQVGTKARLSAVLRKFTLLLISLSNRLLERFPRIRKWIIQIIKKTGVYQWSNRQLKPPSDYPMSIIDGLSQRSDEETIQKILPVMPLQTQLLYQEISKAIDQERKK